MKYIFTPNFDISAETLKILSYFDENEVKFKDKWSFPSFQIWLGEKLSSVDGDFNITEFLECDAVNKVPPRFNTLIDRLVKNKFIPELWKPYFRTGNSGIRGYLSMKSKYLNPNTFMCVQMMREFISTIFTESQDDFCFRINNLVYYFPEFKGIANLLLMTKYPDRDVAKFLRSANFHNNVTSFCSEEIEDTVANIQELTSEGLFMESNDQQISVTDNINETNDAFIALSKVRCFSCSKLGHYSSNCPLKRKKKSKWRETMENDEEFEEVQFVEVPANSQIEIVSNDHDELYAMEEIYHVEEKDTFGEVANESFETSEKKEIILSNECSEKDIMVSGEQLICNLIGPINGAYGLIVNDAKSGFVINRVLKTKNEISTKLIDIIEAFINLNKLKNKTIGYIELDNKFNGEEIKTFTKRNNIIMKFNLHKSLEDSSNIIKNQLLVKIKLLLKESGLSDEYWNFAFHQATFLHNYLAENKAKSPWELFRVIERKFKNVSPFGSKILAFNYIQNQKIQKKNISGIFLGYNSNTKSAFILEDQTNRIFKTVAFNLKGNQLPFNAQAGSNNSLEGENTGNSNNIDFNENLDEYLSDDQAEIKIITN